MNSVEISCDVQTTLLRDLALPQLLVGHVDTGSRRVLVLWCRPLAEDDGADLSEVYDAQAMSAEELLPLGMVVVGCYHQGEAVRRSREGAFSVHVRRKGDTWEANGNDGARWKVSTRRTVNVLCVNVTILGGAIPHLWQFAGSVVDVRSPAVVETASTETEPVLATPLYATTPSGPATSLELALDRTFFSGTMLKCALDQHRPALSVSTIPIPSKYNAPFPYLYDRKKAESAEDAAQLAELALGVDVRPRRGNQGRDGAMSAVRDATQSSSWPRGLAAAAVVMAIGVGMLAMAFSR